MEEGSTIDWGKRIKSALITIGGLLLGAVIVAAGSPEWQLFTDHLLNLAGTLGIPTAITGIVGVILAEAWKQWLNTRTIAKIARKRGSPPASVAASMNRDEISLY